MEEIVLFIVNYLFHNSFILRRKCKDFDKIIQHMFIFFRDNKKQF